MNLAHFIKDYIESINTFSDSLSGDVNLLSILQFTGFYLINSVKFLVQYILTFRWFIDFCSIKITIPQFLSSNFTESYSAKNALSSFFDFFETPSLTQYPFFSGLVNSIVIAFPVSATHILWLRSLTAHGLYVGIFGGLGIFLGQIIVILPIVFGFRFLVFPWFSFELIHYVLGIIATLRALLFIGKRRWLPRLRRDRIEAFKEYFILHFCMSLTEQGTLFQYISNISFNPEPTLFEVVNDAKGLSAWAGLYYQLWYVIGLFYGALLWLIVFGVFFFWLGYALSDWFNFPYAFWVQRLHTGTVVLLVAFMLTSFSHYNLDYLSTSPLGFISGDNALKGFHLRTYNSDFKPGGRLGIYSQKKSLETDIIAYDRGRYVSAEIELSYEDLNYEGEYLWRNRQEKRGPAAFAKYSPHSRRWTAAYRKWAREEWKKRRARSLIGRLEAALPVYKPYKPRQDPVAEMHNDVYQQYIVVNRFFRREPNFIQRFIDNNATDLVFALHMGAWDKDGEPHTAFNQLIKYGFDHFAAIQTRFDYFQAGLGRTIRRKYYSNLVYRTILRADLLEFLSRMPKKHFLKAEEENLLSKKRIILGKYFDHFREYKRMWYYPEFKQTYFGTKSYANRVYNQQFHGTLKIVRRLFRIGLADEKNQTILKFDQPLYNEQGKERNPQLHEELKNRFPSLRRRRAKQKRKVTFLKETNPMPFYAGWDEPSRKFLITNYLLPQVNSSIETNYSNLTTFESYVNEYFNKYIKKIEPRDTDKSKTIHFLTWPLSKSKIKELTYSPTERNWNQPLQLMGTFFDDPANINERDLFEYDETGEVRLIYEMLPTIVKRVDFADSIKHKTVLQPLRGGVIWPGNEPLRMEVREPISELIRQINEQVSRLKRGWRDSNP